jgi:hypothetical protein
MTPESPQPGATRSSPADHASLPAPDPPPPSPRSHPAPHPQPRPQPHPPRRRERARRRPAALVLALVLVLATSLGTVAVQLVPFDAADAPSPAQGVARVVAQGVSPFQDGDYVWRMVVYTAQPRDEARAVSRPFGFVVATEAGPLLLSNDDPDQEGDQLAPVARLAPGEVMIVPEGTDQQRASLTDQPVDYVAVEFVPVDEADEIGAGTLVFQTDPIAVTAGEFDMDCVNALLRANETTFIPDYGQPTLILATDGAIDVIPSGGRRRTLQPLEGAIFTGELTIEVNTDAARSGGGAANGKRLMGQVAPDGGAVFFAGVLGPQVPPAEATVEATVEAAEEPTEIPIQEVRTVAPPPDDTPTTEPDSPDPTEPPTHDLPTEEPTAPPDSDDPDDDGLSTPVEGRFGTDPNDFDSDDDGLGDGDEVGFYGTDPLDNDSDGDGLDDGKEVFTTATNPLNPNTDRDGCEDGFEVENGYNPLDGQDCSEIR